MATPITYALRALSTFFPPQKPLLFSGAQSLLKLADLMMASGSKRPLLIADSFLLDNGVLFDLQAHFEAHGCQVTTYGGCVPNPTLSEVKAGLQLSLDHHCDSVLAVGGGSVIDVAKVVAAASTSTKRVEKLVGILKVRQAPLPFYVAPTTSGTGSEVTSAAVISDPKTHKKQFFIDPKYIPIAAALDVDILKTLPPHMTAAVGMDALTHAIEAYICRNRFADTDRSAATAIKLIFDYLPLAYADGGNIKAREMVALAAFLAGYAFTKSSLGYVHAISHQISAHYNTPHGLANAVILPRVLRFNRQVSAERFATLAKLVSADTLEGGEDALASQFVRLVDQLSAQLDIPTTIEALEQKDFSAITAAALSEARRTYAVPKVMKRDDVEKVLQSVNNGDPDVVF